MVGLPSLQRPPLNEPRIEPVPPGGADPTTSELLAPLGERGGSNFFRTMVRNPRIFKRWVPYSVALLYGALPPRHRELLVLRAAVRAEASYLWQSHQPIARECDITDAELALLAAGEVVDGWEPFERVLLAAVDELLDEHMIGTATWSSLAAHYDDKQLIEVPMVVGVYFSIGTALNSFGLQLETVG